MVRTGENRIAGTGQQDKIVRTRQPEQDMPSRTLWTEKPEQDRPQKRTFVADKKQWRSKQSETKRVIPYDEQYPHLPGVHGQAWRPLLHAHQGICQSPGTANCISTREKACTISTVCRCQHPFSNQKCVPLYVLDMIS